MKVLLCLLHFLVGLGLGHYLVKLPSSDRWAALFMAILWMSIHGTLVRMESERA